MPDVPATSLGEALRLLRARGFKPSGHRGAVRAFDGELACKGGAIQIRIDISDWDCLT